MGDSLSTCCTPPENQELGREIVTLQGTEGFDQVLKEFLGKHPRIKDLYSKKWSYCQHVDKSRLNVRQEGTFVGEASEGQHEAIIFYNEGFLYEGEIVGNLREGLGRLVSADGDCYEGKWHDNEPHGEGIYQGGNPRRKYTGMWQQGMLEGRGKATYEDGSHYQGQFHQNMRHGKGVIKYLDGSVYEGDFRNNVIEGFGVLVGLSHKYEGSWKNGKMQGAGKSSWFNEDDQLIQTYEGQYENGLKHGRGEYRWSNGRVFKGQWQYGEIKQAKPEGTT